MSRKKPLSLNKNGYTKTVYYKEYISCFSYAKQEKTITSVSAG